MNHALLLLCSSQKSGSIVGATKASFLGGKKLSVKKHIAPTASRSSVTVRAAADPDRPLWFPGSVPPPWLDGSLPGDFGFDPLGLGKSLKIQVINSPDRRHNHARSSLVLESTLALENRGLKSWWEQKKETLDHKKPD